MGLLDGVTYDAPHPLPKPEDRQKVVCAEDPICIYIHFASQKDMDDFADEFGYPRFDVNHSPDRWWPPNHQDGLLRGNDEQ